MFTGAGPIGPSVPRSSPLQNPAQFLDLFGQAPTAPAGGEPAGREVVVAAPGPDPEHEAPSREAVERSCLFGQ